MGLEGLTIIGESINDSVPSTKKLFDAEDLDGILELARTQDAGGAAYIDVNVGARSPEFMAEMVRKIQHVTARPLSIDTPDPQIARAGLEAYDIRRAGGQDPILNSISALRLGMFDLLAVQRFRPILLVSERVVNGQSAACRTADETYHAAVDLIEKATRAGLSNHELIIDPGIAPIGTDSEGNLPRLLGAMERIHNDPNLAGVHMSVGLSNFTVMLPMKTAAGAPVKSSLESAFLTKAMPLGLDTVIGSVRRKYELLDAQHPAMQCLEDCLKQGGFESIMRVRDFYA
ncbi:MAG: dihydropteroate synthase [Thermoguttaceae bacterium]